MKLKIKVKVLSNGCLPVVDNNGDWIDVRSSTSIDLCRKAYLDTYYIPLGFAAKLPNGYEAILASRSSLPKKKKVFTSIGIGIIDSNYCGNKDEWNMVLTPMDNTTINKLDRIGQFRIQLTQNATIWQKFKALFYSGIKLVPVDDLEGKNRGGLGSTGVK